MFLREEALFECSNGFKTAEMRDPEGKDVGGSKLVLQNRGSSSISRTYLERYGGGHLPTRRTSYREANGAVPITISHTNE